MSEPKFTPGPWIAKTLRHESACAGSVEYAVYGPSGEFIATIWGSPENQKLIAVAPAMHDFGEIERNKATQAVQSRRIEELATQLQQLKESK